VILTAFENRPRAVLVQHTTPSPTQLSIPPGSVNKYTSFGWEGKGRYGSFR